MVVGDVGVERVCGRLVEGCASLLDIFFYEEFRCSATKNCKTASGRPLGYKQKLVRKKLFSSLFAIFQLFNF